MSPNRTTYAGAVIAALLVMPAFAAEKKVDLSPHYNLREPTAAERLQNFKPPPPPPQKNIVDRAKDAVTVRDRSGNTIRPDIDFKHGTPVVGVQGTFK